MPYKGFFDGDASVPLAIILTLIIWIVGWSTVTLIAFESLALGALFAIVSAAIVVMIMCCTRSPYPHEETEKKNEI